MPKSPAEQGRCLGCHAQGRVGAPCADPECAAEEMAFIPEALQRKHLDPDHPLDPWVGRRVDRFLLVDSLGSGEHGRIYIAEELPRRSVVALKLIQPGHGNDLRARALVKRFGSEALRLRSLEHPNIARFRGHGLWRNLIFFAREYVDGRTLDAELSAGESLSARMDPKLARHVLEQVLRALEAADARDLAHRDLKPSNVMLVRGHHEVRVLDFGLAKLLEGHRHPRGEIRSEAYLAPEQIQGNGVGPWTDLYAVGMIAFRCRTGRTAFAGLQGPALLRAKLDLDALRSGGFAGLPPPAQAFFRRALSPDPVQRFGSASAFLDALPKAFAGARPGLLEDPGRPEDTSPGPPSPPLRDPETAARSRLDRARRLVEDERGGAGSVRPRVHASTRLSSTTSTGSFRRTDPSRPVSEQIELTVKEPPALDGTNPSVRRSRATRRILLVTSIAALAAGLAVFLAAQSSDGVRRHAPDGNAPLSAPRAAEVPVSKTALAPDVPAAYESEIQRLDALGRSLGTDPALTEALARVLAAYRERFPREFSRSALLSTRWASLRDKPRSAEGKALVRGLRALANRRAPEAEKAAALLLANAPDHPGALYIRARARMQRGDLSGAERSLGRILKEEPRSIRARYFLARIQIGQDRLKEAERVLRGILSESDGHLDSRLALAEIQIRTGRIRAAQAQIHLAIRQARPARLSGYRFDAQRLMASAWAARGDPERRLGALELALDVGESPELLLDIAEVALDLGDPRRAEAALERCAHACRDAPRFPSLKARWLMAKGDLSGAREVAQTALAASGDDPDLHLVVGEIHEAQGALIAARSSYRKAMDLAPRRPEPPTRLGALLIRLGKPDSARSVLNSALLRVRNRLPLLEGLARAHRAAGDGAAERRALEEVLRLDPGRRATRLDLARSYRLDGLHARAVEAIEAIPAGERPDLQSGLEHVGSLLALGRSEAARTEAARLHREHPKSLEAVRLLGAIALRLQDLDGASGYLMTAFALAPNDARTRLLLGRVRRRQGRLDEAIDLLSGALEAARGSSEIRFALAEALAASPEPEHHQQALSHLDSILEEIETETGEKRPFPEPRFVAEVHQVRGRVQVSLGRLSDAVDDFSRAAELDPDRVGSLFEEGRALYRLGRLDAAARALAAVVARRPGHAEAHLYLGRVHLKGGRRGKATDSFERAIAADPQGIPEAYRQLGRLLWERDEKARARALFRRYLDLSREPPVDATEIRRLIETR